MFGPGALSREGIHHEYPDVILFGLLLCVQAGEGFRIGAACVHNFEAEPDIELLFIAVTEGHGAVDNAAEEFVPARCAFGQGVVRSSLLSPVIRLKEG